MKQNQEIWTDAKFIRSDGSILDFSGLYMVSSLGRVKSLCNKHKNECIMKQCAIEGRDGTIFYRVTLRKDKKRYHLTTHRLVLSSFKTEEFRLGREVNHKVERTADSCINKLSNLEWVSHKANVNTVHHKESQSKAHTNHPAHSKRVRVTDLSTGEITEYPSAYEADRALGLSHIVSVKINQCNGFYKKMNLQFSYID